MDSPIADPEAHIEQRLAAIAQHAALNAYLKVDQIGARAAAAVSAQRLASGQKIGPLDGVDYAVKANIAVSGLPWHAGMAARRGITAPDDAAVVAALRAAGAVVLGMVNLNEGALGADGRNAIFGDCHNPRVRGASPGGSSSGSAAAVAAGVARFALGTDTLGSVRIPAAYCGIVGFKPSYGRYSQRGLVTASRRLDHVGVLATTVDDIQLVDAALAHFDRADPYARHVESRDHPIRRVGVLTDLTKYGVEPVVAQGYARMLDTLRALPVEWVPMDLGDYDFAAVRRAGLLVVEADMWVAHGAALHAPDALSPALRKLLAFAQGKSAVDLARADRRLDDVLPRVRQWFTEVDALCLPTCPQLPFDLRDTTPANQADFTSMANVAGVPAISLPAVLPLDPRPFALQCIAPLGADRALLAFAAQLMRGLA